MLTARVHPADEPDGAGATPRLTGRAAVFPRVTLMWADGGSKRRVIEWVAETLGWPVEVGQHADAGRRWVWVAPGQEPPPAPPPGFRVWRRRWVVERTFAWLGRNRRLSTDDEALPATEETWISAASSRRLLRRLAR